MRIYCLFRSLFFLLPPLGAMLLLFADCTVHQRSSPLQEASKNETFRGSITKVTPTDVAIIDKKTGTIRTFRISPKTTVFGSAHNAYATIKDLAVGQYIAVDSSQERLRIYILRWQY